MNPMPWTRLRAALEDRLAPSLRGRVAFHQARYRHPRWDWGRVWIELDGEELISFDTSKFYARRAEVMRQIHSGAAPFGPWPESAIEDDPHGLETAEEALSRVGEGADWTALSDMQAYLSLSVEEALTSPSPLIRGLAVSDRRLGKRRLRSLTPLRWEHALVRTLYRVRCQAEGLPLVE